MGSKSEQQRQEWRSARGISLKTNFNTSLIHYILSLEWCSHYPFIKLSPVCACVCVSVIGESRQIDGELWKSHHGYYCLFGLWLLLTCLHAHQWHTASKSLAPINKCSSTVNPSIILHKPSWKLWLLSTHLYSSSIKKIIGPHYEGMTEFLCGFLRKLIIIAIWRQKKQCSRQYFVFQCREQTLNKTKNNCLLLFCWQIKLAASSLLWHGARIKASDRRFQVSTIHWKKF